MPTPIIQVGKTYRYIDPDRILRFNGQDYFIQNLLGEFTNVLTEFNGTDCLFLVQAGFIQSFYHRCPVANVLELVVDMHNRCEPCE